MAKNSNVILWIISSSENWYHFQEGIENQCITMV